MKSDTSIRNICIAAIKRRTVKPVNFPLTKMFEAETVSEIHNELLKRLVVSENELPISQTAVDKDNWTLVTTRQIISCINGITKTADARQIRSHNWNDFKGYNKASFTTGEIQLDNQEIIEFFIETGKASMVTIYAIMTLVGQLRIRN